MARRIVVMPFQDQLAKRWIAWLWTERARSRRWPAPQPKWHALTPYIAMLAAAYASSGDEPPVSGGNKLTVPRHGTFLGVNGCDLTATDAESYRSAARGAMAVQRRAGGWILQHSQATLTAWRPTLLQHFQSARGEGLGVSRPSSLSETDFSFEPARESNPSPRACPSIPVERLHTRRPSCSVNDKYERSS